MRIYGLKKQKTSGGFIDVIDENEKKINEAYISTFTTGHGKIALDDLLWSLYFFTIAENEEQRIRQNVAKEILNKTGIFNEAKSGEIVDQLVKIKTVLIENKNAEGTT